MSDDIHRKRAFLIDLRPGNRNWENKVNHMSDIQVVAIYLKEKAKGDKPKPKEEPKDANSF